MASRINSKKKDNIEISNIKEALRASESKWCNLVSAIPDYISLLDKKGKFLFLNHYAKGFNEKSTIGKPVYDFVAKDSVNLFKKNINACLRDKKVKRFEYQAMGNNKIIKNYETYAVPILKSNVANEILIISRDITKQKKNEEDILFKNTLLQTQNESAIDGILIVDENGKIISYNKRFIEIWNIPDKVIKSKSDKKALQSVINKLSNPSEFIARVNYLYKHKIEKSREEIQLKDGRVLDRYSSPIFDSYGKYYGRVWYFRDITKQKKNEEALHENEEKFRTVFYGAADGILAADVKTKKFEFANTEVCKFLGYTNNELIKLNINDIHPKKNLKEIINLFIKLAKGKITVAENIPCLRKDKKIVYADIKSARLKIGTKLYNVGFFRDITARMNAENEIKSLARFPSENPNPIFRVMNNNFSYVNPAGLKLLGELGYNVNRKIPAFLHKLVRDSMHLNIKIDKEIKLDSKIYWLFISPFVKEGYANIYALNITERKEAEEALIFENKKFKDLLQNSIVGILVLNNTGRVLFVNPVAEKLLGKKSNELIGTLFGVPLINKKTEINILRENNEIGFAELSVTYTVWEGKDAYLASLYDITEQKKAERENIEFELNKKTQELKDSFMTLITHDLKQPITPIIGYAELIKEKLKTPEDLISADKIISQAYRLKEMVDKILNLLRLESGNLKLSITNSNLTILLNESINIKKPITDIKKINLVTKFEDVNVLVDPNRLKDVINNLIDNAIKFSKEGGKIELKSWAEKNYVYISVKDYGVGIKKEDLPKLFVKYYQTKEGKQAGGTGLGLALSKELIKAMNGEISLKSEYGKGSEFIIKLPAK
ncbi:Methanogenesis regulatory histidine kinase FilI [Candidatus Tiddalikarchaeum anstoanum]|nr:Methanogenesis regulatory histidine kinase FilI [Candidatus Tiddalikarchaeum anstoanum]